MDKNQLQQTGNRFTSGRVVEGQAQHNVKRAASWLLPEKRKRGHAYGVVLPLDNLLDV
jgi:hypothetical protein